MSGLGNRQVMANNIIYYMALNGKSRTDLCNDLGFKYTTVTGWITAEKYPRIDKIEKLAHYFGITKSDLVEVRTDTPQPKSAPEGAQLRDEDIMFALFDGDGEITDEMFDEVKDFARFVQERERKKVEKDESK